MSKKHETGKHVERTNEQMRLQHTASVTQYSKSTVQKGTYKLFASPTMWWFVVPRSMGWYPIG